MKIHSYDRLFQQAAKLAAPKLTAAPVVEKPATGEHWLLKNGRKVIFRVTGQLATVRTYAGHCCDNEETMTVDAAREKYRKLVGFGWEKW